MEAEGTTYTDPSHIQEVFIQHFLNILTPSSIPTYSTQDLSHIKVMTKLFEVEKLSLNRMVDDQEISDAVKHSNGQKQQGLDGFNAYFYKVCCPIIGHDVSLAIKDFFTHGRLLKQVKHCFITLVPKCENHCQNYGSKTKAFDEQLD